MIRKIGISDEGLFRLAQKLGMGFLADPPIPSSEKYKGIIEYPGFHTTKDFDIAAAYAGYRVYSSYTSQDEDGTHYVTDYPVVVALNMAGHHAVTDYDAVEIVKPGLMTELSEIVNGVYGKDGLTEDSNDDEIRDAAARYTDMAGDYSERDQQDDPIGYVTEDAFSHFRNALCMILEDERFPDAVRLFMQTGEFPDELLIEATNQFRYEEDVDEKRVVGVWFLTPMAGEAVTYEAQEADEADESGGAAIDARWPGFDVPFEDGLVEGNKRFNSQQVYEGEASGIEEEGPQLPLFTPEQLPPPEPDIQYHGTTYLRLLQAAPFLADVLPAPPSPPFRAEEQEMSQAVGE